MYVLPTFNLPCNIWRFGNPVSNPPDLTVVCNLALGRRIGGAEDLDATYMWLLCPPNTDIQDSSNGVGNDTVEAGAGTGRFYEAVYVDDIGAGFPNEHRFARLRKKPTWPTPFPMPAVPIVLVPGPWLSRGFAATFGVAANTITFAGPIVSITDLFHVQVAVIDDSSVPTVNIGGVDHVLAPINSFSDMGVTVYVWKWTGFVAGVSTPITVTLAGASSALMWARIVSCPNAFAGTESGTWATGTATLPAGTYTTTAANVECLFACDYAIDSAVPVEGDVPPYEKCGPYYSEDVGGVKIFGGGYQMTTSVIGPNSFAVTSSAPNYSSWGISTFASY